MTPQLSCAGLELVAASGNGEAVSAYPQTFNTPLKPTLSTPYFQNTYLIIACYKYIFLIYLS
jgi:hypothetical protein